MTPARAIKSTCEKCKKSSGISSKCVSRACKLRDGSLPHLKRIKAHCLKYCNQGERGCVFKNCLLYPYRLGKNPNRKPNVNTSH